MPPRKRARVSQAASPDRSVQADTPAAAENSPEKHDDDEKEGITEEQRQLADLWTDDEEIGLFKGLMRWKPTGIHKHFRILALHGWLLQNHYIHPGNVHTKPAGIRAKLHTLYDLDTLDARENARQLSKINNPLIADEDKASDEDEDDDADAYSEAANKIETEEFSLPADADFEAMIWKKRFPTKPLKSESPPALAELNLADEPPISFTPSFSIEPSDAPTPASRGGGSGRGRGGARKRGRPSLSATSAPRRRSTRQADSVADETETKDEDDEEEEGADEDEEEEDEEEEEDGEEDGEADDDEEDEEEESESESEEQEEESETKTRAPRATRGGRGRRGRGGASSSAVASRRTRKRQR